MAYPVFYHYDPRYRIALYGQRRMSNRTLASFFKVDSNKICLVKAASDATHPGFGKVVAPKYGRFNSDQWDIYADATILTESGSCAAMFTADCCGLVVYEASSHIAGLAHCGRSALAADIVAELIQTMKNKAGNKTEFTAFITGSICPTHFTHDQPGAEKLIEPFDKLGELAFGDRTKGELNIPQIVRHQLIGLGVEPGSITHDNLCTYGSDQLFSYRQACEEGLDKTKRNAVIVTLR